LLEDRNGDLWIGTDRGVSRLHGDAFITDEATEALKDEKIWAIHEDADGDLWFGTRTGGLYRRRLGKITHYTVAQGLASNSIYEILEDGSGNLWMSGPNGISVINRHELDALAGNQSRPIALTLYSISDGLETTQIYGGEKPAGVLTAQGEVWFPSNKGPISVSLEKAKAGTAGLAPAVIYQVVADGREIPALSSISLGPDNAKLEIHYGVVLLRSQERVRFRYILEGFDKNWTEASSQRVAYYTNLPPGRYQFRVAAFEMNSPEEISQTSTEIVQRPHLYRTSWFLGCCLLLLATAVWGIYQLRLRQLRGRLQAVLNERSRLAREMHDTLIQGCVSVSALLEAHSSMEDSGSDASQDLLNCARTQLRSVADEARRAVWDLRHGADSVTGIDSMLRRMTELVGREFGVPVECQVLGRPFALHQATAHELLMIVREALYNSVRHGHPGHVLLEVCFERNRLVIQVRDDGCGFDSGQVSSSSATHYGLIGMRERVHRMGGKFVLNSRPGAGTELMIQISRKASLAQEAAAEGDL
jgi:signal transduction histidine kinase